MRVVAIDPAPGKESTVYEGGDSFPGISGQEMGCFLRGISKERPPVLLCWDAPLTGPRNPEEAGLPGDFTQRRIDSFFSRQETNFKTPKGISVRPYAGCPHWTISRSVLGLPRLGRFDADYESLPFRLLPDSREQSGSGPPSQMDLPCVVEIHPAVAAWLWCKDLKEFESRDGNGEGWKYKQHDDLRAKMWRAIRRECGIGESLPEKLCNDDQFDAIVGYILGVKWLDRKDDTVVLLGDRETGAMLLPRATGLCDAWKKFREVPPGRRRARRGAHREA